jgi:D-lactate dehydrogenase
MDVFFYEAFDEEAAELRRLLGASITYEMDPRTVQECGHTEPPARLISIRTQSLIPAGWSSTLGGILSRSTGYDHLRAYRLQTSTRIPCGYLDEYATRAVAEHAMMTTVALFHRLKRQTAQFGAFNRDGITGLEFAGKRLLVTGVGRIGGEIVRLARAMGMVVRGVDIVKRHADIEYTSPEDGIRWADAVICAMNLTEQNRGYFHAGYLKNAKPGLLFINVARGQHARTADLLQLLKEGFLGGVALDVFNEEPEVADALRAGRASANEEVALVRALAEHPDVILTPHNAFNTAEAVRRKCEFTVRQVRHFLEHGDFLWKLED